MFSIVTLGFNFVLILQPILMILTLELKVKFSVWCFLLIVNTKSVFTLQHHTRQEASPEAVYCHLISICCYRLVFITHTHLFFFLVADANEPCCPVRKLVAVLFPSSIWFLFKSSTCLSGSCCVFLFGIVELFAFSLHLSSTKSSSVIWPHVFHLGPELFYLPPQFSEQKQGC